MPGSCSCSACRASNWSGVLLVGGELFFDPADFSAGGPDLDGAASAFEHDELFAVEGGSGAVGHGGDAVAEEDLARGHIDVVVCDLLAEVGAAGEREGEGGKREDGSERELEAEHSVGA